jgi:putative endonuclease
VKQPAVYILASQRNGTLYIGVTSNLIQRVWQHKEGLVEGFTRKYGVKVLVWYELHETMESAIGREKAMKKWRRDWKLKIIEQNNPHWYDLWPDIIGDNANLLSTNAPTPSATPPAPVVPAHAGTQRRTACIPISCNVVPAYTGTQNERAESSNLLDSRMRGNDDVKGKLL